MVRFENLSGDPSLEWVGRGAAEFLSRSLQGAMDGPVLSPDAIGRSSQALGIHYAGAPGVSAARINAIAAGANRVIAGYIERTSEKTVRITASEEDEVTHRSVRTLSATAATPFEALILLARRFSARAGPPPTANAEAFRLYCTAIEGTAADAAPLLQHAVALDPGFGRGWIALAHVLEGMGDRSGAADAIGRARAQKLAPVDLASLELADAALRNDRAASLAAMKKMYELSAGDGDLGLSLAEAETNAGHFPQAAAVWRKLAADRPTDPNSWNQLGYTLSWSGDYAGALAAMREYARLRPNDSNPLDSEGDVHYWFGKFAEASASYSAADAKTPGSAFLKGGDLYKAAWAKFRAGDKAGAEALFGKFRNVREKAGDPSIVLFAGDWLYRTGRAKEAAAYLRAAQATAPASGVPAKPEVRAMVATQLTIWDLLAGDRAAAAKDAAGIGTSALTPAVLLARFAAMPTASASEWEARAAHLPEAPQLAVLRASAIGYALILDGKKQAALPVWEGIVTQSPGTDFFSRSILARLKGQPLEHAIPPDAVNLNQFAAVLDKL